LSAHGHVERRRSSHLERRARTRSAVPPARDRTTAVRSSWCVRTLGELVPGRRADARLSTHHVDWGLRLVWSPRHAFGSSYSLTSQRRARSSLLSLSLGPAPLSQRHWCSYRDKSRPTGAFIGTCLATCPGSDLTAAFASRRQESCWSANL